MEMYEIHLINSKVVTLYYARSCKLQYYGNGYAANPNPYMISKSSYALLFVIFGP